MAPTSMLRRRAAVAAAAAIAIAVPLAATSPAQATPGTGQTRTITGIVKNADGTPAVGASVSYDNRLCDLSDDIDGTADDSGTVTTTTAGAFSFPAYATQCYTVSVGGPALYQGQLDLMPVLAAGTSGAVFTLATMIDLDLTVPGLPLGTPVQPYVPVNVYGKTRWYAIGSGSTDAAGKVTLSVVAGYRYALRTARSVDYYSQYLGGGVSTPSLSGGAGTFVAPSTGTSFARTLTAKKSSPVVVSLANVDVGASVSTISWASLDLYGAGSDTTTSATSITLRGLVPGRNYISLSGSHGADNVFGEKHDVVVKDGTTTPVTTSITASVAGTDLSSSTSSFVVSASGTFQVGKKLTASTTFTGPAAPFAGAAGTTIRYFWLSGTYSGSGADLRLVGEGTSYTIPANQAEDDLLFVFAFISAPGQETGTGTGIAWVAPTLLPLIGSTSTYPTATIAVGDSPFPSALPAVSGKAAVGQTLTASPGAWSPRPAGFRYQWSRSGKAITGATARTYRATAADVGKTLSVTVTPVMPGHAVRSVTSAPTAAVAKATAKVAAKLARKKVKHGKKAKVTVKVTAAGVTPSGRVTVTFGKKKVTKALEGGKVTVASPKLKKRGKVRVKVAYQGSATVTTATLAAKKAKKLTVKVR